MSQPPHQAAPPSVSWVSATMILGETGMIIPSPIVSMSMVMKMKASAKRLAPAVCVCVLMLLRPLRRRPFVRCPAPTTWFQESGSSHSLRSLAKLELLNLAGGSLREFAEDDVLRAFVACEIGAAIFDQLF